MQSEARNVSSGVPFVISHVIYLDDHFDGTQSEAQPLLMLHTDVGFPDRQQCWSVRGDKQPKHTGPRLNPFMRAKHVGGGPFSAPTTRHGRHAVAQAEKYVVTMDAFKHVEMF